MIQSYFDPLCVQGVQFQNVPLGQSSSLPVFSPDTGIFDLGRMSM